MGGGPWGTCLQNGGKNLLSCKFAPNRNYDGFTKYSLLLPQSEHSRKNFFPSFRIRSLWPTLPHVIFIGVFPSHSPHLK